jgi:hypothetical protein
LPLVVGRELPVAAAGNGPDGSLKLPLDGVNGAAGSADIQQVGIFCHQRAFFEIFGNKVVSHLGRQVEEEHGQEDSAGPRVGGQQGLHLSHQVSWLHVSYFWKL